MKKITLVVFLMSMIILKAFSQWSDDPMVNTIVNNLSGEQAVPHIAYDSDGNFYIGFYSNESGNYNIRLHYFSFDGIAQWGTDGLLVSSNPQNSWITEWDLTTDTLGNCVLAFNDVRDGNANVYAYSISPTGTFLWGANGIGLTTDPQDEYVPSITVTGNNDVIVAWSRPTSTYNEIVMQKITPGGTLSWGSSGITYQAGSFSYTGARVLGVENDNFIMVFYKETGSFPNLTRNIYAQKFDGTGAPVWTSDVLASNSNGISAFNNFSIKSDNANGVVIAWTDDRDSDNNIDAAVQRVLNDGSITWPANGSEVSSNNGFSHQNPRILGVTSNDEVMVVWDKKTANQNQTAIAGQKFSSDGTRQWTNDGIEFVAMSGDIFGNARGAVFDGTNAMIVYDEYVAGSSVDSHINVLAVDGSGNFIWSPSSTLLASRSTDKSSIQVTDVYNDQLVAVWKEGSSSDIYMQNIFTAGTLGEPPISHDATLMDLTVNDETVEGFDPEIYNYSMAIPAGDPLPVTGATATDPSANVDITQASAVPGDATVLVTAEDGITQLTYTVSFYVASTDATLSDLTINDVTVDGFSPAVYSYDYTVPTGDPIPVVGATTADPNASVEINQAVDLPGSADVLVTAEDGTTTNTYTVNFLYTPGSDATLSELTVNGSLIDGFDPIILDYDYGVLPDDPIPYVNAQTTDPYASFVVTQCESVPGEAIVAVTADDGVTTLTYTVSVYYFGDDASLSDLTVDGMTIPDFDPEIYSYEYFLEPDATIPVVDGTTTDPLASLTVTQAEEIPGNATLDVVAEDGLTTATYTVHFYTWSTDASLSDLTVDGETIEGFDPDSMYYEVDVYQGNDIPVIDGTPNDENATMVVTQATGLPGDGTIVVTAQDGVTQQIYVVHFNLITSVINQSEEKLSIYPNPASNKLFVDGMKGNFKVEIVNLVGNQLYQGEIKNHQPVDISFLNQGVYFAVFSNDQGVVNTIKFLKK